MIHKLSLFSEQMTFFGSSAMICINNLTFNLTIEELTHIIRTCFCLNFFVLHRKGKLCGWGTINSTNSAKG